MTALLLDTHAVVWAIHQPERLSNPARSAISDPARPLVVSAASAWELSTKHRIGKLPQATALLASFEPQVHRLGATLLDITAGHALLAGGLDWEHRDPFDRMLAAQALSDSHVLVTRDQAFSSLRGLRTLW